MASIQDLEQELEQTEAKMEGLTDSLATNKAKDLVKIITPTGAMKGHITGLTVAQYREFIGSSPSPKLLRKLEGQTTEKIPWHLIFDQLATERGFESDEALKEAIEAAKDDTRELEKLKHQRDVLIDDIRGKVKKELIEVETLVMERQSEMFPKETLREEVTEVDGSEITAYRQHPYWTIEVDLDKDGKVDHKFRIRYAKEARKLVQIAISDIRQKKRLALQIRTKRSYAPKRRVRMTKRTKLTGRRRSAEPVIGTIRR